jgi:hypothetical protein
MGTNLTQAGDRLVSRECPEPDPWRSPGAQASSVRDDAVRGDQAHRRDGV